MLYKYFLPNLTYVTALPCETRIFSIVTPRWNVLFATNYLTTELVHSKLKYGLFSISCHDSWAQNRQNSCSKCTPCTDTCEISYFFLANFTLHCIIMHVCTWIVFLHIKGVSFIYNFCTTYFKRGGGASVVYRMSDIDTAFLSRVSILTRDVI